MEALRGINIKVEPPGPEARKIIEMDEKYLARSTKSLPIVAKRGYNSYIEDVDGNVFLDFTTGISTTNIGYMNKNVLDAVEDQLHKLWHFAGTDFYYEAQVNAARSLAEIAPGKFNKKVFFANSGAESNEASLKVAKNYTKKRQFIGFIGAFHGRTMGALAFTASKPVHHSMYFPEMPGVVHVPYPNPYRNPFGINGYENPDELVNRTIDFIEKYTLETYLPANDVAAIMVEPIQGEGGYIVPPENFHTELIKLAHENNILLIMDEVQTGFGRTGYFFASEYFNVEPDIISVAKSIASGIPMGASIFNEKFDFDKEGLHSNTFGGNLLASVACTATIKEIKEKKMLENSRKMGKYLNKRLNELKDKYEEIGDVRGLGLMQAIDFVNDRSKRDFNTKLRDNVIERSFKNGLLLLGAGESAIRLIPPLIITEEEIDSAIEIIDESISKELK